MMCVSSMNVVTQHRVTIFLFLVIQFSLLQPFSSCCCHCRQTYSAQQGYSMASDEIDESCFSSLSNNRSSPTSVQRCPACGCVCVVSRMPASELRLIKFGPGIRSDDSSDDTLPIDLGPCACLCHCGDVSPSRSLSPIVRECSESPASCPKHSHALSSARDCCKCYRVCRKFIERVRSRLWHLCFSSLALCVVSKKF